MITRRNLSKLALSAALVTPARAAPVFNRRPVRPEDWARLLQEELTAALKPGCEGWFETIRFDLREAPSLEMDCVLRLHWSPGWRQRRFVGTGEGGEAAFGRLIDQARGYFGAVWTQPDGRGCFG